MVKRNFRISVICIPHGKGDLYYWEERREMLVPQMIEPAKVVGHSRKRRINKLYEPGHRVRGDVAV